MLAIVKIVLAIVKIQIGEIVKTAILLRDATPLRCTGLSTQFLADKPFFHEAVEEFLAFIGDAPRTPGAPRQVIIFIFTWSPSRFWPRAEAKRDGELPRQFSLYTIASLVLPRRLNCRLLALAYSPVCVFLASQ